MKFTKIPEDTFQHLQLNAGIVAKAFSPETGALQNTDIMGATSGGLSFEAKPTFKDGGGDIDNCPKNTMELKVLEAWEVKFTGNFVTVTPESAARSVGVADVDGSKITPRGDLKTEDFKDLWLVCDYSNKNDEKGGGFVAVHMLNSLSTGGFKLQTKDKDKGTFAVEFTAHYSLKEQMRVPFEIYIQEGTEEQTEETKE